MSHMAHAPFNDDNSIDVASARNYVHPCLLFKVRWDLNAQEEMISITFANEVRKAIIPQESLTLFLL